MNSVPHIEPVGTPTPPSEGWAPPTTIGGNWTRVNEWGIYETWPRPDRTRYQTVLSPAVSALLGRATNRQQSATIGNSSAVEA